MSPSKGPIERDATESSKVKTLTIDELLAHKAVSGPLQEALDKRRKFKGEIDSGYKAEIFVDLLNKMAALSSPKTALKAILKAVSDDAAFERDADKSVREYDFNTANWAYNALQENLLTHFSQSHYARNIKLGGETPAAKTDEDQESAVTIFLSTDNANLALNRALGTYEDRESGIFFGNNFAELFMKIANLSSPKKALSRLGRCAGATTDYIAKCKHYERTGSWPNDWSKKSRIAEENFRYALLVFFVESHFEQEKAAPIDQVTDTQGKTASVLAERAE